MEITKKQEKQIEDYIRQKLEEKTATRQKPSLPPNWTPPDAKPQLSKEDAKAVDADFRKRFKPDPPRA